MRLANAHNVLSTIVLAMYFEAAWNGIRIWKLYGWATHRPMAEDRACQSSMLNGDLLLSYATRCPLCRYDNRESAGHGTGEREAVNRVGTVRYDYALSLRFIYNYSIRYVSRQLVTRLMTAHAHHVQLLIACLVFR